MANTNNLSNTGTNLCIICGTKVYFGEDTTLINSRKEICLKFTFLVARFLKLESTEERLNTAGIYNCNNNYFSDDDDVNINTENNIREDSICCFTCLSKVQVFCDIYHKLECVQLELFQSLDSLSKLMEVTSSKFHNKFRKEFISKFEKKRQQRGPCVRLERLDETELQRPKLRATEIETKISSRFVKTEMHDAEDEECVSRCSDDFAEHVNQLESNVLDDDDGANLMNIGDNYIVHTKIENTSPQKAICVKSTPKTKPHLPRHCILCEKKCPSYFNLQRHIRTHISEKVFHCRICLKEVAESQQLRKHKLALHQKGGVKCDICSKRVLNIESHCIKAHKPVTEAFCENCGRTFNCENKLKRHINIYCTKIKNRSKKTYFCDTCGKTFKFPVTFRRHMERIHGKATKSFKCPYFPCEQAFYDDYHLLHHIRTHTGERPYQCDQCGSAFSQRGSLKIHMDSHSKIKKISCEICGQGFRHIGTVSKITRKNIWKMKK